ncbi:hypothetical protein EVAR_83300_1, partial [Eumeta japonica]
CGLVCDIVSSDRVDCIGLTCGTELNNKYENKETFTPVQGTVVLHIGLTDEDRGERAESSCKSDCGSIGSGGSGGVRSSKDLNGLLRQRDTLTYYSKINRVFLAKGNLQIPST